MVMKNLGGRPTKYNDDMIQKVHDYLETCVDTEDEFHKTRGEKSDSYDRILKVKLPTIEGLARYIGVNKTTLYEWANDNEGFSNALEDVRTEQQKRLIDKGLSGEYNSTIAKLILSSNHGMREKTDVTSDDEKLSINITTFDGDKHTS